MPSSIASKQRKGAKAIPAIAQPTAAIEPPKTDQLISQRQSTDVVQTLLHGSISCLSYVRNLFPESCFDDQVYDNSKDPWSYEEYAAGRGTSKEGTKMKVLRRGRSRAVDQLLDWLEKGAFEALKLNLLRAIQLNILEDASEPSKVVETYTFTFNYLRSPQTGIHTLIGLQVEGPRGKAVTVKNAKYALQAFIRRLMSFCATLPNLPERRFLSMHLFYMPECDQSYQPFGFRENPHHFLSYPNSSDIGWIRNIQEGGMVDAGYHTVGLKISYLEQANIKETTESDGNLQIPAGLEYTEVVAREDDIDAMTIFDLPPDPLVLEAGLTEDQPLPVASVANGNSEVGNTAIDTSNTPIGILPGVRTESITSSEAVASSHQQEPQDPDQLTREPAANSFGHVATLLRSKTTQFAQRATDTACGEATSTSKLQTQFSQSSGPDSQVRIQLREMLQDSQAVPDLEDTQQAHHQVSADQRPHTSRQPALQLSKSKLSELLDRNKSLLRQKHHTIDKHQDESTVDCQCGCNEEEDDMINCSFCETWQHLQCYGYRSVDDPRVPSTHACYRCLLEDKEAPLLHELKNLALLRRGIHIIQESGFSDEQKFARTLHCDLQTAAGVFKHLRGKGLVVSVSGRQKDKAGHLGKNPFAVVTTQPQLTHLMNEYFEPMAKISHHFLPPNYGPEVALSETAVTLPPLPVDEASVQHHEKESPLYTVDASIKNPALPQSRQNQARQEPRHDGATACESNGTARYSLRQRRDKTKEVPPKRIEAPGSISASKSRPNGKRRRSDASDEMADPYNDHSQSHNKRYKSSVSAGLIKVGHESSPAPCIQTTEDV